MDYQFLRTVVVRTVWKVSLLVVILVGIFPHLDWIRRDTQCLSVLIPNAEKSEPE